MKQKTKMLSIMCLLMLLTSITCSFTDKITFVSTDTASLSNGHIFIRGQKIPMLTGTATDVTIRSVGSYSNCGVTLNNAKAKYIPATVNPITVTLQCEVAHTDEGFSGKIREVTAVTGISCNNCKLIVPGDVGSTYLYLVDSGAPSLNYRTSYISAPQARSNALYGTTTRNASSIVPYNPCTETWKIYPNSALKSCVYGSCTLINSTVEGAPFHRLNQ